MGFQRVCDECVFRVNGQIRGCTLSLTLFPSQDPLILLLWSSLSMWLKINIVLGCQWVWSFRDIVYATHYRKRDHLGFFVDLAFLVQIVSSVCVEFKLETKIWLASWPFLYNTRVACVHWSIFLRNEHFFFHFLFRPWTYNKWNTIRMMSRNNCFAVPHIMLTFARRRQEQSRVDEDLSEERKAGRNNILPYYVA